MILGITDHLEGARDRNSAEIFDEVADLVRIADEAGARYFWFTEHHGHSHHGHLPAPLLYAVHLAGRTRSIHLGTAVICLNLHHPLDVAEQVATADLLTGGRLAPGFGRGSAPREPEFFGLTEPTEDQRHARFDEALRVMRAAWSGDLGAMDLRYFRIRPHRPLPVPGADLPSRCWIAVNSIGAAKIAGAHGLHMMFSHLRTADQQLEYVRIYRDAGGAGLIAQNRPIFVGPTDADARAIALPALRTLWRRFQFEGKVASDLHEPSSIDALCGHPINFIVGSARTVTEKIVALREQVPFDVLNAEVRWEGLSQEAVCESLRRLLTDVVTRVSSTA